MDFINQHNAWIATMISAGAGACSVIIAFIVNREKLFDFIKECWFYIVGGLVLFGLFCLYHYGALAWGMQGLGKLIGVSIPIWASFIAFAIVMVCWWIFRNITIRRTPDEMPIQKMPTQITQPKPKHKLSPEKFHVRDYVEDLIDGVWWQWTYSGNTLNVPKPICPNRSCQCDLFFREDWGRQPYHHDIYQMPPVPVSLNCPRCSFRQDFNTSEPRVLNGVTQEILSRVRTDRFRGILYNRAMNQQERQS